MVMSETWRKTFSLWAKTHSYLELVTETRMQLYDVTRKNRCYVAFSGGKDSTVMLHLALQCQKNIPVLHWDYGVFMPRDIEREVQDNMKNIGAEKVTVKKWLSGKESLRFNQIFYGVTREFIRENNLDIALVGLRSEESFKRKRKIKRCVKGEVYPLADWGWRDVWAYIISNNLPYSKVYDVYAPLLGWDKARFSTFFDSEFDHIGASTVDGFFFPQYRRHQHS